MPDKNERAQPWRSRQPMAGQRPAAETTPVSEADVVSAARGGDLRAWEWIIQRNQALIFRSAYLTTRDSALAEAATLVVATQAYRSLSSLHEGAQLRPWLLRLTDTIARRQLRETTNRRDARISEPEPCPRIPAGPSRPTPGVPTLPRSEQAILIEAFDRLSDDDRATIAARYAFGLGREAAAARLGTGVDAVDDRLAAALSRLRLRVRQLAGSATASNDLPAPGRAAPDGLGSMPDHQLGSVATAAILAELPWTPDVTGISCERLAREAVAYPSSPAVAHRPGGTIGPSGRAAGTTAVTPRGPVTRRGPSTLRSVGLLAGATLIGVSFVFSTGLASDLGGDAPAVGSSADRMTRVAVAPAPPTAVGPPVGEPSPPSVSVVGVRRLERGALKAVVRIEPAAAADGTPTLARLERKVGEDAWAADDWADAEEPLLAVMRPDTDYRFRVRTVDSGGDEAVSETSRVKLYVRSARSERLARSRGDWRLRPGPSGGKRLVAIAPGAQLRTTVRGSNVALVGRDVPAVEAFSVRVDGGPWELDPAADTALGRWVLFSEDLEGGQHRLDVLAPSNGLAIDALLILRSLQA